MGRTVIVSEETIRSLVSANAALSAWYHEWLRAAREQTPVAAPPDATRTAFLKRIGDELPEVKHVVAAIGTCPMFVPPPLSFSPRDSSLEIEPPQAIAPAPVADGAARPPLVNPREVKY